MQRREFIILIGGATVAFTCFAVIDPSEAQTVRRKRLGYLSGGRQGVGENTIDILKASLRDLGWRANETIDIDERWADGDVSRLARFASELVQLRPDVIAVTGSSEAKALQAATQDIPIVFHMVADPVANGVVASISRPGGNITGFAQGPQILWSKRLGLLTEMLGHQPRHLAWLGNPGNAGSALNWADAKDATTRAGADIARIDVSRAEELDGAFKGVKGSDGLLVQWDFLLFSVLGSQIAQLAVQERVPAIYENRAQVLAGGLMSYGGDLRENFRQGASYVDRILKGARPADLPVIQASRFELVLNKAAAKALGLTIPDNLLARADEVIE
jgi:putative tryptophan/tyrosine transport system substrate-binding protein